MLISFDMETRKADCTDPEEHAVYSREQMAVACDRELMLGLQLQLQEYTWVKPEIRQLQ